MKLTPDWRKTDDAKSCAADRSWSSSGEEQVGPLELQPRDADETASKRQSAQTGARIPVDRNPDVHRAETGCRILQSTSVRGSAAEHRHVHADVGVERRTTRQLSSRSKANCDRAAFEYGRQATQHDGTND